MGFLQDSSCHWIVGRSFPCVSLAYSICNLMKSEWKVSHLITNEKGR